MSRPPSKTSPSIEQEVPLSNSTTEQHRRRRPPPPPPPPPLPIYKTESIKTRLSRRDTKSTSNCNQQQQQQRASSAISTQQISTTKRTPMREEHLLKRASSADRIGRERWLHHITESSAANNGFYFSRLFERKTSPIFFL